MYVKQCAASLLRPKCSVGPNFTSICLPQASPDSLGKLDEYKQLPRGFTCLPALYDAQLFVKRSEGRGHRESTPSGLRHRSAAS